MTARLRTFVVDVAGIVVATLLVAFVWQHYAQPSPAEDPAFLQQRRADALARESIRLAFRVESLTRVAQAKDSAFAAQRVTYESARTQLLGRLAALRSQLSVAPIDTTSDSTSAAMPPFNEGVPLDEIAAFVTQSDSTIARCSEALDAQRMRADSAVAAADTARAATDTMRAALVTERAAHRRGFLDRVKSIGTHVVAFIAGRASARVPIP